MSVAAPLLHNIVTADVYAPPAERVEPLHRSSRAAIQAALLLVTGMALGPSGLGVLTARLLVPMDASAPVILAMLGVMIGLGTPAGAALPRRGRQLHRFVPALAVLVGSTLIARGANETPRALLMLSFHAVAIALIVATVGWLLVWKVTHEQERRVFSLATLLLLGGAADYLSVSALGLGLTAGYFWRATMTRGIATLRMDLALVEAPAIALLLIFAGSRVDLSWQAVGLTGAGVCCAWIIRTLFVRAGFPGDRMDPSPLTIVVALAVDAARLTQWAPIIVFSAVVLTMVPIGFLWRDTDEVPGD